MIKNTSTRLCFALTFLLFQTVSGHFGDQNGYSSRNGLMVTHNLDATFKPNKSWIIRTSSNLNSKNVSVQGYTSGIQSYTISLGRSFLANVLNLIVRFDNLFALYRYVSEITMGTTFHQQTETRYINRTFRFSVRWRWGKKTVNRPQVREIGGY